MECIIAKLLQDFETGKMDRRQLIKSLAVAATAACSSTGAPTAEAQGRGFKTIALEHISYQVTDYNRTRDFYADLMGMTVSGDNGTSCQLQFGNALIIARNRREPARAGATVKSVIDHIAFKIDNWETDRVEAELKRRGYEPRLDTGAPNMNYGSFHVNDPGWLGRANQRRPQTRRPAVQESLIG